MISFVFLFPSVVTSKHLNFLKMQKSSPQTKDPLCHLVVSLRTMPAQIWSLRPLRTTNCTRWSEICKKNVTSQYKTLWIKLVLFPCHVLTSCPLLTLYICSQKTPGWEVHHDCSQAHRADHRGLFCYWIWLVSSCCLFLSAHLNTRVYSTFSWLNENTL